MFIFGFLEKKHVGLFLADEFLVNTGNLPSNWCAKGSSPFCLSHLLTSCQYVQTKNSFQSPPLVVLLIDRSKWIFVKHFYQFQTSQYDQVGVPENRHCARLFELRSRDLTWCNESIAFSGKSTSSLKSSEPWLYLQCFYAVDNTSSTFIAK